MYLLSKAFINQQIVIKSPLGFNQINYMQSTNSITTDAAPVTSQEIQILIRKWGSMHKTKSYRFHYHWFTCTLNYIQIPYYKYLLALYTPLHFRLTIGASARLCYSKRVSADNCLPDGSVSRFSCMRNLYILRLGEQICSNRVVK